MFYLPFYSHTHHSRKNSTELKQELELMLHPAPVRESTTSAKPVKSKVKGTISGNEFLLKEKVKNYRTVQSIIYGEIHETAQGSEVKFNFRPNTVNMIFMLLWFSLLLWGCYYSLQMLFAEGFSAELLTPFALLLISYPALLVSTRLRMKQLEKHLIKNLDLDQGNAGKELRINYES